MEYLRSEDEHIKLCQSASDLKLITFGLTEASAKFYGLDFINKMTVLANFDNDKSKWGKGFWDIETLCPDSLLGFMEEKKIEHLVIMSEALIAIGEQLDVFEIKYYSAALLSREYKGLATQERDQVLTEVMKSIAKPVQYCEYIGTFLNFWPQSLLHCCRPNGARKTPVACSFSGGVVPISEYRQSVRKYTLQNIANVANCEGCVNLSRGFPSTRLNKLKGIAINNEIRCQLNCKYCREEKHVSDYSGLNTYSLIPAILDLISNDLIVDNAEIEWSGGEPTLNPSFDELVEVFIKKNYYQKFFTNAVGFSEKIAKTLALMKGIAIISVDSGTAETYKIVKGVDRHNDVWENVKRYSFSGKNCVVVKYIITEDNMGEKDLVRFVQNCVDANVAKVIISALYGMYDTMKDAKSHQMYLNAARKLYNTARQEKITVEFSLFNTADVMDLRN